MFQTGVAMQDQDASSSMISSSKSPIINVETLSLSNKLGRLHSNIGNVEKFKGIVPQKNGHWGAQIYANHQRIWLGTFKTEKEAAMAYDSAAIKLRSTDLHRNFPWNDHNVKEPSFQNQYSTERILNMIRDGSYQQLFVDFLMKQSRREEICGSTDDLNGRRVHVDDEQFSCMQLFQKDLTPSDVGKLNRLVIPKKFAVKYFPYIFKDVEDQRVLNSGVDDTELIFYDRFMKSWKFRYCYWRSSQSFVFTKGWNKFVREKKLKEKDIIAFYTCAFPEKVQEQHGQGQYFSMIDIVYCNEQSGKVAGFNHMEAMQRELAVILKQNMRKKLQRDGKELKERVLKKKELKNKVKGKGFRLFGVQISDVFHLETDQVALQLQPSSQTGAE
ncbi:B3 DOMAIN-CONTAINING TRANSCRIPTION FACTOR ABI3 [Salix purpurea]|uniref:B3 DOMAIN-CONTAINING TRANSCRIPTION FACTOR ABI3 n=1 Tax=Salix purpurea TaxID=77065 RepID=A0A9Q0QDN7_SALPP|nr:B3 DOMAIN-CONTAINING TRANSCRIPTION FACTOR ABI3 [Salix purpurea]